MAADIDALAVRPALACKLLGFGKDKLYALIKSGEIASFLEGPRTRLIPRAAIDDYLARRLGESNTRTITP